MTSALAALILLSACSVDGHAVNDSDPAASAAIDVKSLDTGKYPTEPRKPFGKPTVENVLQYEGQRMAQFIVVPFEVDPDLWLQEADLTEEFYRTFDGKVPPALYAELAALRYRLRLAQSA